MKKFLIIFMGIILSQVYLFANSKIIVEDNLGNNTVSISTDSYKILEFKKGIKNIKLTDSKKILVEFVENGDKPFTLIKVLGKTIGNANAFITFQDNTTMQIDFNIVQNLKSLINLMEEEYPSIRISQIDNTIILKGNVKNENEKDDIYDIFRKANIDSDKRVINLLKIDNPTKMVKVKLYVVEINNQKGKTIKNNWSLSGSDSNISTSITSTMLNAVTLSGGITAVANTLGGNFNVGLTLKYLQNNDVAKILDETTLITLEKNKSQFHSGGTLNVKVSSTDITSLEKIDYGLKMDINVQEIVNNKYIKLLVRTESSVLDTLNTVDGIPSIKNKTVDTNVIVGDKSTVVLGGLINIEDTKNEEKVPLLGDIPLVGGIFRSTNRSSDDAELLFFITPEIIDPANNNQLELLNKKSDFKNNRVYK